jgi:3-oxoacyl-[acyl-carrier-protein] synthase III
MKRTTVGPTAAAPDVFVGPISYSLGDVKSSLAETAASGKLVSGAAELSRAGFRDHYVCSAGVTAYALARQAVMELTPVLQGADAIVYATCLPSNSALDDGGHYLATADVKHLMDYPASRLQAALGLDDAIVIGITQQACTGLLGAIRLARALVVFEPDRHKKILCLTSDRFPIGAIYEQAYNLISDGAAACLVTPAPGESTRGPDPASDVALRILATHHITNGAMVRCSDDETVGSYFAYTHRLVTETLAHAGLRMADIDWVVPQNTNDKAWQIMARVLGIDPSRVWAPTLGDIGHMISGDNLVNLDHLVRSGAARPGERVLLTMAGYGMNWQSLLLEVTAL